MKFLALAFALFTATAMATPAAEPKAAAEPNINNFEERALRGKAVAPYSCTGTSTDCENGNGGRCTGYCGDGTGNFWKGQFQRRPARLHLLLNAPHFGLMVSDDLAWLTPGPERRPQCPRLLSTPFPIDFPLKSDNAFWTKERWELGAEGGMGPATDFLWMDCWRLL